MEVGQLQPWTRWKHSSVLPRQKLMQSGRGASNSVDEPTDLDREPRNLDDALEVIYQPELLNARAPKAAQAVQDVQDVQGSPGATSQPCVTSFMRSGGDQGRGGVRGQRTT